MFFLFSKGETFNLQNIYVEDVIVGQNPKSLFYPPKTYFFKKDGDWDKDTIEIEKHPLYISYKQRIIEHKKWEDTPYYEKALVLTENGGTFRGGDFKRNEIYIFFQNCDKLIAEIKDAGYKSNKQLFSEKNINKVSLLSQEVTINLSRNNEYILNDGWNRFIIAKILGIKIIPVRILIRHKKSLGG